MSGGGTLTHAAVTVGATATIIHPGSSGRDSIIVQNRSGVEVFIGSSTVTTANSVGIPAGQSLDFTGDYSSGLYGIVATGTAEVRYLNAA